MNWSLDLGMMTTIGFRNPPDIEPNCQNPPDTTLFMRYIKLLGYMVSHRGIDPNPEKVSAITKMKSPESLHDVQKLTGCMSAFSRFIS
jgi:hypothetical protein